MKFQRQKAAFCWSVAKSVSESLSPSCDIFHWVDSYWKGYCPQKFTKQI